MAASNASALAIQFESCILVNGAFCCVPTHSISMPHSGPFTVWEEDKSTE